MLFADTPSLYRNGSATTTASSRPRGRASRPKHQRKDCANKSYSEPPPSMVSTAGEREHRPGGAQSGVLDGSHKKVRQGKNNSRDCQEETPDGDMSESSLSGDDDGRRKRPAEFGRSQNTSSVPGGTLISSSQKASLVGFFLWVLCFSPCRRHFWRQCSVIVRMSG